MPPTAGLAYIAPILRRCGWCADGEHQHCDGTSACPPPLLFGYGPAEVRTQPCGCPQCHPGATDWRPLGTFTAG